MAPNRYTGLFFLDEATAFAAGHRPCAECRREDYVRFMELVGEKRAGDIDERLHAERLGAEAERMPSRSCRTARSSFSRTSRGSCSAASCFAGRPAVTPIAASSRAGSASHAAVVLPALASGWNGVVPFLHPSGRALIVARPAR